METPNGGIYASKTMKVLILPMRNGNFTWQFYFKNRQRFLSYLWGMETYIRAHGKFKCTVFLSYLWGMETYIFVFTSIKLLLRSYPTYEEWKQFLRLKIFIVWLSSYPTYEEWKHIPEASIYPSKAAFYPTYKEWKLGEEDYYLYPIVAFYPTYKEWKHREIPEFKYLNIPFLSYLWGIKKQRDAHIARLYNLKINDGYNMFL